MIKSLSKLIGISVNFDKSDWHDVVGQSGIIQSLSILIVQTANPKIRMLCGTVMHIIQQRGSEIDQPVDWQTILKPLITLLFCSDEQISETGKQSLLKILSMNPVITNDIVQLGLLDQTSELLDQAFPSTSGTSSQQQLPILLSQIVLLNILEVIGQVIKTDDEFGLNAFLLRNCLSRIMRLNLPTSIILAIGSIPLVLEDELTTDNSNDIQHIKLQEAQNRIQLLQKIVIQKDESIRIEQLEKREYKIKLKEEQSRSLQLEERLRIAEEQLQTEEKLKKEALQQIKIKDEEIQHQQMELIQILKKSPVQGSPELQFEEHVEIDLTSQFLNPDETGQLLRIEQIDNLHRKAVILNDWLTVCIPLDKVITDGIHSVSVQFQKCNSAHCVNGFVGIVKAKHEVPCPCNPLNKPHYLDMLFYNGFDGTVKYKGHGRKGNSKFSDGQLITMEL
ncbi:MAG: hypothetical protein EZS28_037193, partial [Streblomastix strix]